MIIINIDEESLPRNWYTASEGYHEELCDPDNLKRLMQVIRQSACKQRPDKPLAGPVKLTLKVFFPPPRLQCGSGVSDNESECHGDYKDLYTNTLIEIIKEALKTIYWEEDSQVIDLRVGKWHSDQSRVEVIIEEGPTFFKDTHDGLITPH